MYIEILKRVTEIRLNCLKIRAKKVARAAPVLESGVLEAVFGKMLS